MNDELMQAQVEQKYAAEMARHRGSAGQTSRAVSAPSDFNTMLARIKGATMDAREAAAHADSIASTLHGHRAELNGIESARDQRSGLIGQYEDALDELVSAISDTRSNLRRISNGIPDQPKSTLG